MRRLFPLLALTALLIVCSTAAAGLAGTAIVVNDQSNSISLVATTSNTVVGTVGVGSLPLGIAITPSGDTAYVVNLGTTDVTPVALTGSTPVAQPAISFASDPPNFIAIAPDSRKAYVTDPTNGKVVPLDLTASPPVKGTPIGAGTHPEGIVFAPDGATAYVTDNGGTSITPITVATDTAGAAIPVGHATFAIAITPDGRTAYATSLADNVVVPIDLATKTAGPAIPVGLWPQGIAITPDGHTAYVADGHTDTVTPIDTATNGAGAPIAIPGTHPYAIAVTPDGNTVYVTDGDGTTVTPITVASGAVGSAIGVGNDPRGLAITPNHSPPSTSPPPDIFSTITLPSSHRCLSRRVIVIHIGLGRAAKLHFRSVRVLVNGRQHIRLSGAHLRSTIDLRGLPKGTFRVTILGVTTDGRHLKGHRTFHTCAAKRRHHKPGHGL